MNNNTALLKIFQKNLKETANCANNLAVICFMLCNISSSLPFVNSIPTLRYIGQFYHYTYDNVPPLQFAESNTNHSTLCAADSVSVPLVIWILWRDEEGVSDQALLHTRQVTGSNLGQEPGLGLSWIFSVILDIFWNSAINQVTTASIHIEFTIIKCPVIFSVLTNRVNMPDQP